MKETLKQLLHECVSLGKKGNVDPSRYPSQVRRPIYIFNSFFFRNYNKYILRLSSKYCFVDVIKYIGKHCISYDIN